MSKKSKKLWEKSGSVLDKDIESFEIGNDYFLDMALAPYDIFGSLAHIQMLNRIGILSDEEHAQIKSALNEIFIRFEEKAEKLDPADEDIHTKVELLLTEQIGDIGKKVHTARSRNDQVLVDIRLYTKHQLCKLALNLTNFCEILYNFGEQYQFTPMPGYTHMQVAMPSSVGMWITSFIENVIDELAILDSVYELNDMNPLGSGAGYGVSIDIDRQLTADLLGFGRVQKNSIYCGNSRGKVESHVLNLISGFALILNRLATDVLLFTTREFNFFRMATKITTGSSIMPQKKNLDVMELIRGKTHTILGYESQMKHIIANVPSGYNRDYQETKGLLMNAFTLLNRMIKVTGIVIENLEPNEGRLAQAHKPEIYATDAAYRLVKQGIPFRDAYRQIGDSLALLKEEDPVKNIKSKKHIGAPGNLQLDLYSKELAQLKREWTMKSESFISHLNKLLE